MSGALSKVTERKLLSTQILSVIGSGLTTIALGILAYKMANKNIGPVLGFAFVIKTVVHLGVAPTASALAERIPRKPFLVFLDITRAMPVLVLPSVAQI